MAAASLIVEHLADTFGHGAQRRSDIAHIVEGADHNRSGHAFGIDGWGCEVLVEGHFNLIGHGGGVAILSGLRAGEVECAFILVLGDEEGGIGLHGGVEEVPNGVAFVGGECGVVVPCLVAAGESEGGNHGGKQICYFFIVVVLFEKFFQLFYRPPGGPGASGRSKSL